MTVDAGALLMAVLSSWTHRCVRHFVIWYTEHSYAKERGDRIADSLGKLAIFHSLLGAMLNSQ